MFFFFLQNFPFGEGSLDNEHHSDLKQSSSKKKKKKRFLVVFHGRIGRTLRKKKFSIKSSRYFITRSCDARKSYLSFGLRLRLPSKMLSHVRRHFVRDLDLPSLICLAYSEERKKNCFPNGI